MSSLAGPFPFGLSFLLGQNRGGSGEEVGIACARHSAAELTMELASTVGKVGRLLVEGLAVVLSSLGGGGMVGSRRWLVW